MIVVVIDASHQQERCVAIYLKKIRQVLAERAVDRNMARGIVALVLECRITGGAPTATSEAAEVRWLLLSEVRELMDEGLCMQAAGCGTFRSRDCAGIRG
jgi:hypothetical protein